MSTELLRDALATSDATLPKNEHSCEALLQRVFRSCEGFRYVDPYVGVHVEIIVFLTFTHVLSKTAGLIYPLINTWYIAEG